MKYLVTGSAGFIGFHVSQRLLKAGHEVVGFDSVNDYYDVNLKEARLAQLTAQDHFTFYREDLADKTAVERVFDEHEFDAVIHLAAQAGVRYSLTNPHAYIDSNIVGFCNILEGVRHHKTPHLIYASSSSVYGANETQPFKETHSTEHPLSLYAATKKANEMMAHSYSNMYDMPVTGLRFFTVYGPWGRPDMALFLFTKGIIEGKPIDIFNHGDMIRDFTFVDDIAESIVRLTDKVPTADPSWSGKTPNPATSRLPYRVFNIGNHSPVKLMDFIEAIEEAVGKKANQNMLEMQVGDVPSTHADVEALAAVTGFRPKTNIRDGVGQFVKWYRDYYGV